ncbi:SDR family NAD(P)-dependent oxidoreductase [Aristophania vespae]|nr:SDR family NAD(P)-dependent oxidoreductase [Aristophania vespae]
MSKKEEKTIPNSVKHHVLITGGSSGIGAALASYYARPGVHITLWGRNEARLQETARKSQEKGASTSILAIDLSNAAQAVQALIEADNINPVDILILSAGMADIRPAGAKTETSETALQMSLVNFATPVAMATEAASRMAERQTGRIGILGSVASFHDLPLATVYSGSKAGLGRFSTALRAAMEPYNVKVTLIAPGFIDTPMSQRLEGNQPFLVPVDKAARQIARSINRGQAKLVFPWVFQLTRLLEALLPSAISHRILRALDIMQHPPEN